MAWRVKDPALSWLQHGFDPWPGNRTQPAKRKERLSCAVSLPNQFCDHEVDT